MTSSSKQIKRHRDPLSPKPILDRAALLKELKSNGIVLKNGQIDLFYQLLHRSDYPPLKEFVAELRGEYGVNNNNLDHGDDDCSVSVNGSLSHFSNDKNTLSRKSIRTKNAISARPGRMPQLPKPFLNFLSKKNNEESDGNVFATLTSKVKMHQTSSDGSTTKIAVELQDGHVVESVLMRHEGSRATLCVSSQVG